MQLQLVKIGKPSLEIDHLIQMYAKRLKPYVSFQYHELKDGKNTEDAVRSLRKPGDALILLDERGKQFSSKKLSEQFKKWLDDPAVKSLTFVIGGPYGVSDTFRKSTNLLWSLSELTLQGDLASVVCAEQIYRAFMILKGTDYHHA